MAVKSSVAEQVVVEVEVAASPETIWPFFTDPEKLTRWMGSSADLDPRPGGIFTCQVTPKARAVGEFVELDRPKRVVFTNGWEGEPIGPGSTTVEVTLEATGDKTLVRLVHSGLPAAARDMHRDGWSHYFGRLEVVAAGGDPGVDPHTLRDA